MCGKAQHVLIHDVLVIGQYLFIDVLVIRSPAQLPTSQRGTQHPAAARPAAVGESPVDEAPTPPLVEEALADSDAEHEGPIGEEFHGEPTSCRSTGLIISEDSVQSVLLTSLQRTFLHYEQKRN